MIIHQFPILDDNYQFIIETAFQKAIIIDPGDGPFILDFLKKKKLTASFVLLTHRHPDHIQGLPELVKNYPDLVVISHKEAVPSFVCEGIEIQSLPVPGHTLDLTAYYLPGYSALFSGDLIFGLGCGRIFEGTFEQGYQSLQKLKNLPLDTRIYCSHEYTEQNLKFALSLKQSENSLKQTYNTLSISRRLHLYEKEVLSLRKQQSPTVPLHLGNELNLNPFLLCQNENQFKEIRTLRNHF